MWLELTAFIGFLFLLYMLSPLVTPKQFKLYGSHVVITGGSSGIGKCLAIEMLLRGANITIIARNQLKLESVKTELEKKYKLSSDIQKIFILPLDVSQDYEAVSNGFQKIENEMGPVDILVNCAGTSTSGQFEDLNILQFKEMMNVNFFGSVYATHAVIKSMKQRCKGRIVFISSQAGQIGLYGYTAYSSSKFALRGLAESLYMELKPYNVLVTLMCPPDTNTPGFIEEQKCKPRETQLISESSGLFQPEDVAQRLIRDIEDGKFLSYVGLDGYMLTILTCGMAPVTCIMEGLQQVVFMGFFRLISFFYLKNFERIIKRCMIDRKSIKHS